MNLDEVQAREEIREVVTRYFRAMDRVDDELGYSIFHEDGTGDYGPGIFSGPARELIDWLNAYNRTLVTSHHQMSNSTIEVAGDRAASETYVTATLLTAHGDGHIVRRVHGRYIDRLSKRGGRWAIDHRFYRRDFFWEEHVDEISIGESAARTLEDPSYLAFASLSAQA
jgi:hypothetical protein